MGYSTGLTYKHVWPLGGMLGMGLLQRTPTQKDLTEVSTLGKVLGLENTRGVCGKDVRNICLSWLMLAFVC